MTRVVALYKHHRSDVGPTVGPILCHVTNGFRLLIAPRLSPWSLGALVALVVSTCGLHSVVGVVVSLRLALRCVISVCIGSSKSPLASVLKRERSSFICCDCSLGYKPDRLR